MNEVVGIYAIMKVMLSENLYTNLVTWIPAGRNHGELETFVPGKDNTEQADV